MMNLFRAVLFATVGYDAHVGFVLGTEAAKEDSYPLSTTLSFLLTVFVVVGFLSGTRK